MSRLSFEDIKNGNWYGIPAFYARDTPSRIYKTIYNGNNYIKSVATTNQQEIVQVPANEMIFSEPDENDIDELEDDYDKFDDDDYYMETLEDNQLHNFRSYNNPNEELNLPNAQKLELYNIFVKIEKDSQKGGRRIYKKRRSSKKRRTSKKRRSSKRRKTCKKRTYKRY